MGRLPATGETEGAVSVGSVGWYPHRESDKGSHSESFAVDRFYVREKFCHGIGADDERSRLRTGFDPD